MSTQTMPLADSLYDSAMAAHEAGRHADAVRMLWQASEQGHVAAMTLLGGQLLSGRGAPPDPTTGARLILQAAKLGGGSACALAAVIVASGVFLPADWAVALDYLQRAAELGHEVAQEQLKLLSGRRSPVISNAAWAQLRRRIDVDALRRTPPARALSEDPSIRVFESFAPRPVCDWIIRRARDRLQPAAVFDTKTLQSVRAEGRSNSVAGFDLINLDLVMLLTCERLAAAAGLMVAGMEAPQVFHYAVGQTFEPHNDFLDAELAGHAQDIALRGQRIATLLIYLNEGFEGGETDFPLLNHRFRGGTGDALMFANVDPAGAPERRMLHAGLAPTSGEKWLFSQWVRSQAQYQRQ